MGKGKVVAISLILLVVGVLFLTFPITVVDESISVTGSVELPIEVIGFRNMLKITLSYELSGLLNLVLLKGEEKIWSETKLVASDSGTEVYIIQIPGSGEYVLKITVGGSLDADIKVVAYNEVFDFLA